MKSNSKITITGLLLLACCSCHKDASVQDIKAKIVLDYPCPNLVTVNNINIISQKQIVPFLGSKGFEYLVSGEVEWKMDCTELGNPKPKGYKEKFTHKSVILIEGNSGWK